MKVELAKYLAEMTNKRKKNMKAMKVRVPHPKGGMAIGKVVRYDKGSSQDPPFYVVDTGEYASLKVPAHKVEAENHDELTKQFKHIFAEVQIRLQEKCFGVETHIDQDGEVI